jgi:putative ABC transport system permease protein
MQFLSEAVVLSVAGGVLGMIVGFAATYGLQRGLHWEMDLNVGIVIVAAVFSVVVGLVFGYYPAHRASQLDPIRALRFE